MSEDAALMREIASISGKINNHRRLQAMGIDPNSRYGRGRGGFRRNVRGGMRAYRGRGMGRGGVRGAQRARAYGRTRGVNAFSYHPVQKIEQPCLDFTSTGKCRNGLLCRYQHDSNRVALCKSMLWNKKCTNVACTLSHSFNEHNTPLCIYYARGNCTNTDCNFVHMDNVQSQRVCASFSVEGWCNNGAKCSRLHVFECPEFANTGRCTNAGCKLQHAVRAKPEAEVTASWPAKKAELINVDSLFDGLDSDDDAEQEAEQEAEEHAEAEVEEDTDSVEPLDGTEQLDFEPSGKKFEVNDNFVQL